MTSSPSPQTGDLLRHYPAFFHFWFARLASGFAFQMVSVAVGWQIYDLTDSALNLGLIGLIQFIPAVLLALPAGHIADQFHRRKVVVVCQIFEWLALVGLAVMGFAHLLNEAAILCFIGIISVFRTFENPSARAIVPALVPERILPRALAINGSGGQAASIIGPALGGFLYILGPSYVYAIVALMTLTSVILMVRLHYQYQPPKRVPMDLKRLFSGVVFIRQQKTLLGVLSLDLFAVLLGGATALLPIFAKDILHTGAWGLGLLRAAPAVGALLMSFFLAKYTMQRKVGLVMFGSVAGFGVATIIFALSSNLWLSLGALFALGALDMISMVIRSTLVQLETPDEMRGRVGAVNSIFINTSNQLGEFESGIVAAAFGAVNAALIGGIGTLVVVGLWMMWFPTLRKREKLVNSDS